jgi:WD40 repeat protein
MKLLPVILLIIFLNHASAQESGMSNEINAKPYKVLKGHKYKVQNAFFSPNGKFIVSHGWDNTVKTWDVETFSEIRTFEGHTDQVWRAAVSPDNKLIASGSLDRTFIIWDVETGEKLQQVQISPYNIIMKGLVPELDNEFPNSVYGLSFSPNGKELAIATADKLVRIWDLEKNMFTDTLDGQHTTNWMKCSYSPDGKYLVSRSYASRIEDGMNVIWETETYSQVFRIALAGKILFTDHNEVGIYAGNNMMNYYNLSDGSLAFSKPFPDYKGSLELSPDRKYMVSCNEDSYIILRNVKTQEVVWTYKNKKLEIHNAHFSPDGKYLIAGRPEADILIWKMESLIKR